MCKQKMSLFPAPEGIKNRLKMEASFRSEIAVDYRRLFRAG